MKRILYLLAALLAWASSNARDFDPAANALFTTSRPDGRFISSRGIAHKLMLDNPPRLQYRKGMDSTEFAKWQEDVTATMTRLMAHPEVSGQPKPECVGTWKRDGYTIEKWEAYPFPDAVVSYLVLIPEGVDSLHPAPAIMCIPGWGQTKELLAGESDVDLDKSEVSPKQASMAHMFAKEGYVAVAVDNPACGEPDDLERIAGRGGGDYANFARSLLELGWNYLGYASYVDNIILQWMKTQPEMRKDRLVVSGFSFGTEPLMALGAMDKEIFAFVYNDFLCTTRERALVMTVPDQRGYRPWPNDIAHLIPGMLMEFDFPDIVASLAPRPVICTEGGMDRDFDLVADAFATAGCPDNFESHHYQKFIEPTSRQWLDSMPEGITRDTFFRLANVDPPHHYFKSEHILPWLRRILTSSL